MPSNRARSNGQELLHRKANLNVRKNFTVQVPVYREVVEAPHWRYSRTV